MHCDLRVRWKVASDLRFRAAISEPKTPSCCGISGDLAQSTRKSLAIAIVRFWCAKVHNQKWHSPKSLQQMLFPLTERGVFAFDCQYIVSPRGRTSNRTVTQMRHILSLLKADHIVYLEDRNLLK